LRVALGHSAPPSSWSYLLFLFIRNLRRVPSAPKFPLSLFSPRPASPPVFHLRYAYGSEVTRVEQKHVVAGLNHLASGNGRRGWDQGHFFITLSPRPDLSVSSPGQQNTRRLTVVFLDGHFFPRFSPLPPFFAEPLFSPEFSA